MRTIKLLLGKKDLEGHNPKMLIASKNLTFMKKTLTGLLEQNLKETNSEYSYDKAHNIITVGNVELLLIPDEDESSIYGFSCCCFKGGTLITTDRGDKPIEEIKEGDLVLTRNGYKKVTHSWCSGEKDCISVNVEGTEIICTPEHRFIDIFDNEIEAQDLTKTTSLVKVDHKECRKWQEENGLIEKSLKLLTSMESDIIAIQNQNLIAKGAITHAQMSIRNEVTQLITEICGSSIMVKSLKDMMSTIKMETISTILLKISNCLQELNTLNSIGKMTPLEDLNKLKKLCEDVMRSIRKNANLLNTGKIFQKGIDGLLLAGIYNVNVLFVERALLLITKKLISALQSANEQRRTRELERIVQDMKKNGLVKSVEKPSEQTSMSLLKLAHLTAKTSNVVGRYTVYDIEVEDCHEFFANGVLVHNCAYVDELDELDTQTAMAVVKSINDRCRQQIDGFRTPFMAYTTSSQGLKGTYQTIMHFQKSGIGYVLMRARTKDNIFLPKDYVANMYSIYNEKEIACLLEGQFVSIDSGLIFPDYHKDKNLLDTDLYDYVRYNTENTVYIGQDFNGFGNNAIAFAIINGCIVAIKDYEFPDIRRAPEVFRYDFPNNKIVWIPDMTYKEHFVEFKKELRVFNINIAYRSCNPLVGDRNFACNKLFIAERLFICPMCKDTERTLMTWQKDPKTGLPMKGGKGAPDHKGDCLGYVVHYLLSWCRELKPLYDVTLRRLYEARRARGADATELEVTSQIMSASKLKGIPLKQAPNTVATDA